MGQGTKANRQEVHVEESHLGPGRKSWQEAELFSKERRSRKQKLVRILVLGRVGGIKVREA
jgi:hypothetical protein